MSRPRGCTASWTDTPFRATSLQTNKQERFMVRIILGVIVGFFAWMTMWVGSEKVLSAIFPQGYGAHQAAFQAAVENGASGFTVDTTLLLIHIIQGLIVSVMSGFLAALVAGENKR